MGSKTIFASLTHMKKKGKLFSTKNTIEQFNFSTYRGASPYLLTNERSRVNSCTNQMLFHVSAFLIENDTCPIAVLLNLKLCF